MAQIVIGNDEVFNALISGPPQQRTIDFVRNQFNNYNQSAVMSVAERKFYEQASVCVEQAVNSNAMRLAQSAARKLKHGWDPESIRYLPTIGEIQFAPVKMQRYIMANPTVRQLYHQGKIDGYSDTYADRDPGLRADDHYDYRRVMNGIIVESEQEDPDLTTWTATSWWDDIDEADSELLPEQQFDILDTWDTCEELLESSTEDFTSVYGGDVVK